MQAFMYGVILIINKPHISFFFGKMFLRITFQVFDAFLAGMLLFFGILCKIQQFSNN